MYCSATHGTCSSFLLLSQVVSAAAAHGLYGFCKLEHKIYDRRGAKQTQHSGLTAGLRGAQKGLEWKRKEKQTESHKRATWSFRRRYSSFCTVVNWPVLALSLLVESVSVEYGVFIFSMAIRGINTDGFFFASWNTAKGFLHFCVFKNEHCHGLLLEIWCYFFPSNLCLLVFVNQYLHNYRQ